MRFTRYEFVDKIAVGGMAEVWAARATAADGTVSDVVVKRILPQFADDATFQGMLLEEAVVTAGLHHPNIVRVLDWGHLDETCFLAMERVHGLDARQLLAACAMRKIPVPVAVALYAVAEILAGLDYAHRRTDENGAPLAIVHRDVSPANVLLSVDGRVKLSDFGIAKAKTRASHTRVGRVRGKPRYMSPEQARGEVLDGRSDLFSAGLVLHELLTGKPVFPQSEYLDQVVAIIERGIPPPSQVNPLLPPDLDALVLSLCERDLAQRHPSGNAAREAILAWAAKRNLRLHAGPVADLVGSIIRPTQTVKPVHAQGVTRIARLEDVDGMARFASTTDGGAGSEDVAVQTRVSAVPSSAEPTSTVASRGPVPGGIAVEAEPSVATVARGGAVPDGIAAQVEPSVPTVARRDPVPDGNAGNAEPSVPTVARGAPVPAEIAPDRTERRPPAPPQPSPRRRPWLAIGAAAVVVVAGVWRGVSFLVPQPVVVSGNTSSATATPPVSATPVVIARSVADFAASSGSLDTAPAVGAPADSPVEAADESVEDEVPADALIRDDEPGRGSAEPWKKRPRRKKAGRGAESPPPDHGAGADPVAAVDAVLELTEAQAGDTTEAAGATGAATAPTVPPAVQPSPTPAGKGWLSLRARPNGEVTIDGQWAGRTPITRQELAAGEHTVVVHADDGRKATAVIVIDADLVTSRTLDLK